MEKLHLFTIRIFHYVFELVHPKKAKIKLSLIQKFFKSNIPNTLRLKLFYEFKGRKDLGEKEMFIIHCDLIFPYSNFGKQ